MLEGSAPVRFHGLGILTEAHLRESALAESLRIAWKRMERTVVPLKRIGCTQLHKIRLWIFLIVSPMTVVGLAGEIPILETKQGALY